jgi:hypothetical protein
MPVSVGVTLTVQGSNFAPGAQVVINGSAYAATWASPTSLTLLVPSLAAGSHSLIVRNPDSSESAAGPALVIAGPAPTATPDPAGPLVIEAAVPFPNPDPRSIRIKLAGPADRVTLKVYTVAWVLAAQVESGPLKAGWNSIPLPAELAGAPSGLYYLALQAQAGERRSEALRSRFYRAR